jgi:hypothetical protein
MVIVTAPCFFKVNLESICTLYAKKTGDRKNWRMDRMEYNTLGLFTGWWVGPRILFSHSVGNGIIPTDELHNFLEG